MDDYRDLDASELNELREEIVELRLKILHMNYKIEEITQSRDYYKRRCPHPWSVDDE
jgi:hypothetical protein